MPIYEYEKKGKTHYYYAFEVQEKNGKRKTIKQRGFTGKIECRKAEAVARAKWEEGRHFDATKVSFKEYCEGWADNKPDWSKQSRYNNLNYLKLHVYPHLGDFKMKNIGLKEIEEYIKVLSTKIVKNNKTLAQGTVKKIFNLVNTAFKDAVHKELIQVNPVDLLPKKPRVDKTEMNYWSVDEVKSFLNGFEHRQKIIFILAIFTGMRMQEILALKIKDINLEQGKIYIRNKLTFSREIKAGAKTTSGIRMIDIGESKIVLSALQKHISVIIHERQNNEPYYDHDLLICAQNGNIFPKENCRRLWYLLLKRTGVRKIRFHDLRHTCASLMFQATPPAHPKVVQELLGHSSIRVTLDKYSHMVPTLHSSAIKGLESLFDE